MRVLVAGATGQQGGSVVDALLAAEREYTVRGLTRNRTTREARTLRDRGVDVFEGNMTDREAMDRAVTDVDAVFGVTAGAGAAQREQGLTLVAAADAGDPERFVFSSGGNAHRRPGIPEVDAKRDVEERLAETGLRTTVVRPHSFTTNFFGQRRSITDGTIAVPMPEDGRQLLVDPADVGRFAARALAEPARFDGVTVELAAESLTLTGIAAAFTDVLGRPVEPSRIPPADVEEATARFVRFLADCSADLDRLRTEFGFRPRSVRESLRDRGWGQSA